MVQWLTVHLPVPGTWVRSLVQEGAVSCGATKPRATTAEPGALEPHAPSKRSHSKQKPEQRDCRKPECSNEDPAQPQIHKASCKKDSKISESPSGPKPRDPSNCLSGHSLCSGFGAKSRQRGGWNAAPALGLLDLFPHPSSPACQEGGLAKQELGPGPQGGLMSEHHLHH